MLTENKISLLKNLSAELTHEEAIWASGYLAGLAKNGAVPTITTVSGSNGQAVVSVDKFTLAYGTETGNSKKLATQLAAAAKKSGIKVKLTDLSQYKFKDLAKEEYFFLVVSTQGEGEPPASAKGFYDFIHENSPSLTHLKFGILALGDTSYPHFCKTGEDLDARFEALGAHRTLPLKKCDTDYEEDAEQWLQNILDSLKNTVSATAKKVTENTVREKKKYHGTVTNIINLNDSPSDKETYHIEIESSEEIVYQPGDALGVLPVNPAATVEQIITITGISPEKTIETGKITATVKELLSRHLNIFYLLKSVTEQYAKITGHDIPETRMSLLDLLQIYPVKNAEEFEKIIQILTPQVPRLYSISSSPAAHGENEIHITVAKSEFFINGEKNTGLCSGYLSGFLEGDEVEFYIQKSKHFKLPEDDKDLIMIGPGTGIAPFRSFLWERDATGAQGRNWLFFGDRNFVTDFLYQTEIQDFLQTAHLSRLDLAFSRDTAEKVYVQHRISQKAAELFEWLENGATICVCGTKDPMSKDVEAALLEVIAEQGKLSESDAKDYLEDLELSGRYTKDVY